MSGQAVDIVTLCFKWLKDTLFPASQKPTLLNTRLAQVRSDSLFAFLAFLCIRILYYFIADTNIF
jgi:hypothetical protein